MNHLDTLEGLFSSLHTLKCDPDTLNSMVLDKLSSGVSHPVQSGVQFRASSIGKPWITQILGRWYGEARDFNLASAQVMYEGRVAQAWAEVVLDLTPSLRFTTEGLVSHGPIQGHYDILVTTADGKRIVLEVKSMASHILNDFKANPNDTYGYLSQLSFYYHTLKADYAAFLLRDRTNARWFLVEPTKFSLERKWDRLTRVVEQLKDIKPYDVDTLLDVVYEAGIPGPTNGKLPSNMSYSRWKPTLYAFTDDGYVVRPKEEIAQLLKQIPLHRADGVQLSLEFPE